MKKYLQITILLSFFLGTFIAQAQVRMTLVDPSNGMVWLKNYGTTSVDIAGYRFCHNFTYPALTSLTISGGSTIIGAGSTVLISGFTLNSESLGSDVALYLPTGAFTDPNSMIDFMQYGSGGHGRESVAAAKGIWLTNTYVLGGGNAYTRNSSATATDFGVQFWGPNPIAVEEYNIDKKIDIFPTPTNNVINVNLKDNIKVTSYKIINILGKVILENNDTTFTQNFIINVAKFKKGNYTLFLYAKDKVKKQKIIII